MNEKITQHFTRRARKYNQSSAWVKDKRLIDLMFDLSGAGQDSRVLDLACGTGLVSQRFYGRVKKVIGVDMTKEMAEQSREKMDELVISRIEDMDLPDESFDICVCRQGLQFVDLQKSLDQIFRILKPNGTVVLCHLTAYPQETERERQLTFEIQRLRNPARKNFFEHESIQAALKNTGFKVSDVIDYISRESINQWTDHGAIETSRQEKIGTLYKNAPEKYKEIHQIEFDQNDIYDHMLLVLIKAVKK